jgi:5-methylcytosine-specific restriction endonuclease McrA
MSKASPAPVPDGKRKSLRAAGVERDDLGGIKRSSTARRRFLRSRGLTYTPPGCQVDHVVPLAKGGADIPANMQLLCGEALRKKEASELP